jgi:hypothetical protein
MLVEAGGSSPRNLSRACTQRKAGSFGRFTQGQEEP